MGSVMQRSLTIKTGQAHVQRYMRPLLELIENGDIDPSFVITHRMPLEDAPYCYDIFNRKKDNCIKVVLKPDWAGNGNGYGGTAKDDNYTVIH
jgi:threonine dehydrogenase-like Zn-dependent dehydrogenase